MINIAVVIGYLTKDIEAKATTSGKKVVSNSIASRRNFKNGDQYESDFIQFTAYGQQADYLERYAKKGDLISITGRIQTRSYEDKAGYKRYITEIVTSDVGILHSKDYDQQSDPAEPAPSEFEKIEELPFY